MLTGDAPLTALHVGRNVGTPIDIPGMHVTGFAEKVYAAAPEEMLGWTKPRDVMSIYEDVGRPNVMPNVDGEVYARGTPTNEPSDGGSESTNPYAQSVSVESIVSREVRASVWQEPSVLSDGTPLPTTCIGRDTSSPVDNSHHPGIVSVTSTAILGDEMPLSPRSQHTSVVVVQRETPEVGAKDAHATAGGKPQPQPATHPPANDALDVASATAELAAVASCWQSSEC